MLLDQKRSSERKNFTNDVAGWQTMKRSTVVLSVISEPTSAVFVNVDYFVDGDSPVRQGRRSYSIYPGVESTLHLPNLTISRSVRLTAYRKFGTY